MFGLGEILHLDIRGVLEYGLEVIWVGHLIDGCVMMAVP